MKQSYKTAFNLIKQYSLKSIFYQYLRKLFLLITLPFLIIFSAFNHYHQLVVNNETQYSIDRIFNRAELLTSTMFEEFRNISLVYSENIYVQLFLNTQPDKLLSNSKIFASRIHDNFNISSSSSHLIKSISIYSIRNKYVLSGSGGGYIDDSARHKAWYDCYKATGKTNLVLVKKNSSAMTLCATYPLRISGETSGIVIFEVNTSDIDNMLLENLSRNTHEFVIASDSGHIIYSSNKAEKTHISKEIINNISKTNEIKSFKVNDNIYCAKRLDINNELVLIYSNDLSEMNGTLKKSNVLFVLCLLFSLLSPLGISLYMSMNFYNSIAKIITLLNVSNEDNLNEINEFDFISTHITDLLDKNKSIEAELLQRTATFKQTQAMALQAQLNPHFLFNTLHLVGLTSRVLLKGKNPISDTVALLSDLLSAALDTHNYIVTIDEEIDYTKKYLEIQRIKYKDNFDVIWDVDENILDNKTIKLILQPLIENSFQHGISVLNNRRGRLVIEAKSKDSGDIFFCVRDNGHKIPQNKLESIRNKLETDDMPKKDHIGLSNVNTRIKIVFGDNYGVNINSDDNGTSVFVTFPKS